MAHLHRGPSLTAHPVVLRRSSNCVAAELASLAMMAHDSGSGYRLHRVDIPEHGAATAVHITPICTIIERHLPYAYSPVKSRKDLRWRTTCPTVSEQSQFICHTGSIVILRLADRHCDSFRPENHEWCPAKVSPTEDGVCVSDKITRKDTYRLTPSRARGFPCPPLSNVPTSSEAANSRYARTSRGVTC